MQAASVDLQSVLRWLTGTKGIAIHEEWLRACVEWILSEERIDSEEHLRDLVYEQWLHADLRDVVPCGCIPDCVAQQHKGQIRGRFIVQIQSVVDVSKPAYGQLQKLKGKSLDEGEPAEKKYPEPKANRLLLLELTDGVTNLQAMEYQPIKQLSVQQLLPGAKLLIEGEIQCRLGVLLLSEGHVQVLGGQVEQLMETNAPRKVLARLLNDENLAGDEPRDEGVPSEPDQDSTAVPTTIASGSGETTTIHNIDESSLRSGDRRPSTTTATGTRQQHGVNSTIISSSSRQHQSHKRSTAVIGDNLHRNSSDDFHEVGDGGGDVSELVGGEVDLDNFEDFDDNLYDEMEMEMGVGGEVLDVPGHHEWPQDNDSQNDFHLQVHSIVKENFSTTVKKTTRSSETFGRASKAGNVEVSTSQSHSRMESIAPKSKLSLRQQKRGKTRVCELERGGGGGGERSRESQRTKNPPVASVKPIQQQPLPQSKVKHEVVASSSNMLTESELYEEPIVLSSIPEVENNSWKLRPFVKIKAHFVRVCEMLDHTSGVWKVTVMIGDDQGSKLRVHLSDKVLETLIGFSAQEFKDHIHPHKDIPKVKARAAKGFTHCCSALEDLNCFMVITRRTNLAYPCVIQLLDH